MSAGGGRSTPGDARPVDDIDSSAAIPVSAEAGATGPSESVDPVGIDPPSATAAVVTSGSGSPPIPLTRKTMAVAAAIRAATPIHFLVAARAEPARSSADSVSPLSCTSLLIGPTPTEPRSRSW